MRGFGAALALAFGAALAMGMGLLGSLPSPSLTDCSITFSEDRIVVHRPQAVKRPVFNGLHPIWVFVLIAADCIRVACPVSTKLGDLKALVSQVSSVRG